MRIVIVEDEPRTRNGIKRLIHTINPGYKVIGEAINGKAGLQLISRMKPDLVITDIRMPGMDGLKMLKNLRAGNILHKTIILSSYSEFEYAQKAISLNVSEYLLKPITFDALKQALSAIDKQMATDIPDSAAVEQDAGHATSKVHSAIVLRTLNYIKNNYNKHISLNDMAHILKITSEYLSSLFKKEVKQNFSEYLCSYRIERAKALLRKTGLKIFEIAQATGFKDPKYFCQVFKKATGLSPKEFSRRNHKPL